MEGRSSQRTCAKAIESGIEKTEWVPGVLTGQCDNAHPQRSARAGAAGRQHGGVSMDDGNDREPGERVGVRSHIGHTTMVRDARDRILERRARVVAPKATARGAGAYSIPFAWKRRW